MAVPLFLSVAYLLGTFMTSKRCWRALRISFFGALLLNVAYRGGVLVALLISLLVPLFLNVAYREGVLALLFYLGSE